MNEMTGGGNPRAFDQFLAKKERENRMSAALGIMMERTAKGNEMFGDLFKPKQ